MKVQSLLVPGLLAIMLAGCQTADQSMMSAEDACLSSGYRPGSRAYNRCLQTAYNDDRMQSQATGNALAAGAAAGLVSGAVIAASSDPYPYGSRPYYGSRVYVGRDDGPYAQGYYGPGYRRSYRGPGSYSRW